MAGDSTGGFVPTPHPVLKLPSVEQMALMAESEEGREKLRVFLDDREKRIVLMETDPYLYGYRAPIWDAAKALLERVGELLVMGGNRSSKTEFAAWMVVMVLLTKPNANVACFHSSSKSSVAQQQPRVHTYLPPEFRDIGKPKGDRVTNVCYTKKNGFSEATFILPNGSQCFFFNYLQEADVFEGYEFDAVWCDELVPRVFIEALRYRVVTRRGWLLVTFTPVRGYTPTVKEYLAGASPTRTERAPLLPEVELVKACPAGHMPRTMKCVNADRAVIFFWTSDNPFNPYDEMQKKLDGATRTEVMLRAYGWTEKMAGSAFAKFREDVHVIKRGRWDEIRAGGVTYYCACDPAPAKNWFIKWYAVTPEGWVILFREWPDMATHGEWAEPGEQLDWVAGPAQRAGAGRGIRAYKELIWNKEGRVWVVSDGGGVWDTSEAEEVHSRIMDPRMGGSPTPSGDEGSTLISLLDTDEEDANGNLQWPAMIWEKGSGKRVFGDDTGVQVINDWMDYDEGKPVDVMNCPRFYVVEDCKQSIKAYAEWSGMGTAKCALKDVIDPDRYLALAEPEYVEPGMFGSFGGGNW